MSPFNLQGKCAVVIGGTSGIGRAISIGLAMAGANVVASSRSKQAVDSAADEIEQLRRATLRVTADVLVRSSLQALHDAVVAAFTSWSIPLGSQRGWRRLSVPRRIGTTSWTLT